MRPNSKCVERNMAYRSPIEKMFMEKQLGLRLGCLFHIKTFIFTFNTKNNTSRICISETDIYYIYWA